MGFFSSLTQLIGGFFNKDTGPSPSGGAVSPNAQARQYRPWRLTYYLIAEETVGGNVPVFTPEGSTILAMVDPRFFSFMSLQGSGKLRSGKLLNVTDKFIPVKHEDYAPVLAYHQQHMSSRPFAYSGLVVEGGQVVQAMTYTSVPPDRIGKGYGIIRGVAHEPFRTLAADIGTAKRSEPRFKGKGGLVPPLTRVYIKEFVGVSLPDGSTHDGWFTVIDSGGGIYGAHFDCFVGLQSLKDQVKIPALANVWFEGIETRVPVGYQYGLRDI